MSALNLLPLTYWHEVNDLIFYFKCRAGHYTLPIADYVKPKGTRHTHHSSDQDVLIPKCRTKLFQFSHFNRLLNSGIRYLNPLVLLLLLISLNLTYSNAIQLLFVQTIWRHQLYHLALVVQKVDSAIHRINRYPPDKYCIVHWAVIYPVDSAIHLLNNWKSISCKIMQ